MRTFIFYTDIILQIILIYKSKKDGRCQKQQPYAGILFQLFVMATTS